MRIVNGAQFGQLSQLSHGVKTLVAISDLPDFRQQRVSEHMPVYFFDSQKISNESLIKSPQPITSRCNLTLYMLQTALQCFKEHMPASFFNSQKGIL